MRSWWAGERTDRVVASVTAPRTGKVRAPLRGSPEERICDHETIVANLQSWLEGTYFGGEAFPAYWTFPAAVPLGIYLGCQPTFREDTTWQAPLFGRWEDGERIVFDAENRYWRIACSVVRRLTEPARGRYLLSGSGAGGLADVLANLFGSETLLMAAASDPEGLRSRLEQLLGIFRRAYDEMDAMISPNQCGSIDWLGVWAPERVDTFQNDLSCVVSPSMFRGLFLEEIRQEARHVEHSLYHLDGPGAIKHLDALLSIEELGGIQWTPGAGNSHDPLDWLGLIRKVQAKGKRIWLFASPKGLEKLLGTIDRRGVYLHIGCRDEAEAAQVLASLDRIGM